MQQFETMDRRSTWTPSASAVEGDCSSWVKMQSQALVAAASGAGGVSGVSGGGAGEQQQPAAGAVGAGTGAAAGAGPQPMSWLHSMTPIGSGGAALLSDTLTDTRAKLVTQNMYFRGAVKKLSALGIKCVCTASKTEAEGKAGRVHHDSHCEYHIGLRRLTGQN